MFLQKLSIREKKDIKKYFYSKFATFTDSKGSQILLIAYVFEKTFYFTGILRQTCNNPEELFERGKILVLEKTFIFQFFSDFEQNIFGLLAGNFGQGFSKVHSTNPEEHCEGKYVF